MAYYVRYLWYLVDNGEQGAEKKFAGPWKGNLGSKRGQNEVLGPYLAQNALVFVHFAYRDWEWWNLVPDGCQSAKKKNAGPEMGPLALIEPLNGFLAIILILGHTECSILPILIILNNLQLLNKVFLFFSKFQALNLGPFRPKMSPKLVFWLVTEV